MSLNDRFIFIVCIFRGVVKRCGRGSDMSWDRAGMVWAGMGCLPYYHKSRIIPRSGGIPMPPLPYPTGMGMGREGQGVQPKQQENDGMP